MTSHMKRQFLTGLTLLASAPLVFSMQQNSPRVSDVELRLMDAQMNPLSTEFVVATRPDSRDAPHLFGLGLQEMIADEMTQELRKLQYGAIRRAIARKRPVTVRLQSKGVDFGILTARPDSFVELDQVHGVDDDLRVRPFFAQGGGFSIREFIVGAFKDEMGLECADPDLAVAAGGGKITTPSGLVLDGAYDTVNQWDSAVVSIGIGQWTLIHGKLQAFLAYVRANEPQTFERVFRQGVGVDLPSQRKPYDTRLIVDGVTLTERAGKTHDAEWVEFEGVFRPGGLGKPFRERDDSPGAKAWGEKVGPVKPSSIPAFPAGRLAHRLGSR